MSLQTQIKLRNNSYEHTSLQNCMEELAKSFLKISNFHIKFSLMMQNVFIEPVGMFNTENQKGNIALLGKVTSLVHEIEEGMGTIKKVRKDYFDLSEKAEKSQKKLEDLVDKYTRSGKIIEKELKKESQKSADLKMKAGEARFFYEDSVVRKVE